MSCEASTDGRYLVELENTIFYAESGGQPADGGRINEARVLDVRKQGGRIIHCVDRPLKPGPVELLLDIDRRRDHSQQHTAQHLLTRLASDRLGWTTIGFGIGETVSHIDFDIKNPPTEKLRLLEEMAAAEIRASRPVCARWVDPEEMARLPVRSRRLPEGLEGKIRLVEIEGVDLNTCGGTHVENTAELESICLVETEPMHGGTRVNWVAGGRVRRRMAEREEVLAEIRRLTGASDRELTSIIELKLSQLREARARLRRMREELGASVALRLKTEDGAVIGHHLEDREMLPGLASALAGSEGNKIYLLLADDGSFALALEAGVSGSAEELGPLVAGALGGKGGGRDRLFRGKTSQPERFEAAISALKAQLEHPPG